MTLPHFLLLLALTTTTAWPLAGTKTLVAKANVTFTDSRVQTSGLEEEWFSFESGPPHCNLRHRIDYKGTSGIISVTDPTDGTYTTTAFTNASHLKQKCTVTGPSPIPDDKCINGFEALGTQFIFSSVGPCPGAANARRCDAWINNQSPRGVMTTFFFISGTNTAVRFLTNSTTAAGSSAESILDFTEWSVNTPVPTSAWNVPSDWQPCMKPTPATTPNLAAPHVGVLGSLMSTLD